MAITAEQASAIATAIDNLNKSVQVNEEVLQIVKSMQSTGAAGSVGEHVADRNAHPLLNNIRIEQGLKVGANKAFDPSMAATRVTVVKDTASGNTGAIYDLWGCVANGDTVYNSFRFNVKATEGTAWSDINVPLGQFNTRVTDSTHSSISPVGIEFRYSDSQKFHTEITAASNLDDITRSYNKFYVAEQGISALYSKASLGAVESQWDNVYVKNAPVVSSDRRLKQDFGEVPEAVFKAWTNVRFCQYRFKEAVEKKGEAARLHIGLIAQEILEAFMAQGLNATDYGIVCYEHWEDKFENVEVGAIPAVLNEAGDVVTPEKPIYERKLVKVAGDQYSVRYEEALALEAAYQRWKLQKIEAALAEKGISL